MPWIVPAATAVVGVGGAIYNALKKDKQPSPVEKAAAEKAEKARDAAFHYGGDPGAAARDSADYANKADQWRNTKAPDINYSGATNYQKQGDESRGLGMEDRTAQLDALSKMREAANGTAPSKAELMMRRGAAENAATQTSFAAGARGPAALAMAQQNAAANTASANARTTSDAGMLRADEMSQARNAYGGMTNSLRSSDDAQRSQDLAYQKQMADQARAQTDLGFNYQQLGQQGQLGFEKLRAGVQEFEGNAAMGRQGDRLAWQNLQNKTNADAQKRQDDMTMGFIKMGADSASAANTGGGKKA